MKLPVNVGSKYRFIILAGQRVAQLQRGARARIEKTVGLKMTDIALQELEDGLLDFHKIGDKPASGETAGTRDMTVPVAKARMLPEKAEAIAED